ncbi:MAG: DUF3810 domain-containing protein [Christensenellales bacterium]|jgi:hypothetical protein
MNIRSNAKLKSYRWPLCLAALAPAGFILQRLFFSNPAWVESVYTGKIYAFLSGILVALTGWIPFSLAEILVVGAAVWVPVMIWRFFTGAKKKGLPPLDRFLLTFAKTTAVACCGYFLYLLLCGFNYARLPYDQIAGYDISPAAPKTLQTVCFKLAEEANGLCAQLYGEVGEIPESHRLISTRTQPNFEKAALSAPWLSGDYGRPKPVLLSKYWAYTQTTGMFFPFTLEANYNKVNSQFMYAATMAHEAAHQRGFMREDEANFIAFYVCAHSDNAADRYSGIMLALIHAGNALHSANPQFYSEVFASYSDGVVKDLRAHNQLWAQYEGKAAEIQEKVNDAYLQSNNQEDGVLSYGRMVNLLIGFYRQQGFID